MAALETFASANSTDLVPTKGWNTMLDSYRLADRLAAAGSAIAMAHLLTFESTEGWEKTRANFTEAAQPPMPLVEKLQFDSGFALLEIALHEVTGENQ